MAKNKEVARIEVEGDNLKVYTRDGRVIKSHKESGETILEILQKQGIETGDKGIQVGSKETRVSALGILFRFLPIILIVGFMVYLLRRSGGVGGGINNASNILKSHTKRIFLNVPGVSFADVAGAEEAKQELQEVVEFLKSPHKFAKLGARIPRGVLLVGLPGTGKTLMARAVAGEAGVPFFHISGSEFVEIFVGVGANRVRELFDQAKRNQPCIVFIDEIDAVGRRRGSGIGGVSHDEREQTLNQILTEMDGFTDRLNVIVIAATNREDILDPALLRPGRFDRKVILDLPDTKGREAILRVHIKGKPLEDDVDFLKLAKQTPGFSGADLANLVNEGAITAARLGKSMIGTVDLEEAMDRVISGPAKRSRQVILREKEIIAYHEAGHALVANMHPDADQVHKVSIVSRGRLGGYTRQLPEEDRGLWSKKQFNAILTVLMSGYAAEEIKFGDITTGACDDLERATAIATQMVTKYGMSDLGPISFGEKRGVIFGGAGNPGEIDYSEDTAQKIDEEIAKIIRNAKQEAYSIISEEFGRLEKLAKLLIENETLEGNALAEALK